MINYCTYVVYQKKKDFYKQLVSYKFGQVEYILDRWWVVIKSITLMFHCSNK